MKHACAILILLMAEVVFPTTYHVPTLECPTIQEGLDLAQDGDTVLVAPGTYRETLSFRGTEIVLLSEDGPATTVIDGSDPPSAFEGSVIRFENGEGPGAVLEGFTLTGGSGVWDPQTGYQCGGGIYCVDASPTIRGNWIVDNTIEGFETYGGGIYCHQGAPDIRENTVSGNLAAGDGFQALGGGIYCLSSEGQIVENTISGNEAGGGGGICCEFSLTGILDNEIVQNLAGSAGGAGIYIWEGSVLVSGNTISDNHAASISFGGGINSNGASVITDNEITLNSAYGGGGIKAEGSLISSNLVSWNLASYSTASRGGGIWSTGSCAILDNVISDNLTQGYGGGITSSEDSSIEGNLILNNTAQGPSWGGGGVGLSSGTLRNCIIAGNSASNTQEGGGGGGVYLANAGAAIENCTLANNTSLKGGAVYASTGITGPATIRNSILWGNAAESADQIYVGSGSIQAFYTDVEGGPGSCWGSLSFQDCIDSDPCFMAGPLSDFHLDPGIPSPCIDAGDPAEMYNDPEDPMTPGYALWPALGTIRNDMGAYGGGGAGVWTGMEEGESPEPLPGNILAAFPNPLAGLAVAQIVQPSRAQATLSLYDLSGRLVLTLFTGELEPGEQFLPIDARALGTGMYFLRFSTAELTACTRITLIR